MVEMQNIGEPVLQVWQESRLIVNKIVIKTVKTLNAKDTMFHTGNKLAEALGTKMMIVNFVEGANA